MTMAPEQGPGTDSFPAFRILIVEDHVPTGNAIAALLHETLGRFTPAGRAVAVATSCDAESALESLAAGAPDVVVMDISLPGMNGIEAARRLRQIAPQVSVIVHSRRDTDVYRAMAAAAGARAFVSKEDSAAELPLLIRRLIEEITPSAAPAGDAFPDRVS